MGIQKAFVGDFMRNISEYQIMVSGKPKPLSEATREELEQDFMRMYDMVHYMEDHMTPFLDLLSAAINGKDAVVDEMIIS